MSKGAGRARPFELLASLEDASEKMSSEPPARGDVRGMVGGSWRGVFRLAETNCAQPAREQG